MMDESICHFRGIRSILSLLFYFLMENPVRKQCRPRSEGEGVAVCYEIKEHIKQTIQN